MSKHRAHQGIPIGLFAEGGEAGGLVRAHDWAATPLGPPERWPHALRTLVGVMLRSRQPMVVAWGPQHTMLYNDSYIPILGQRHPDALGRSFTDVWHDLSGDIGPLIDRAFAGEAVWHEDLPLTLHRKGFDETAYFTFSYTPVHDEKGAVAGMFCACTETTGRVLFARRQAFRVELEGRLRGLADPGALAAAATRMLGPWLRTARVFYIEVEGDDAHGTVTQNWNEPRVPDLMGRRFRLDDLGPALVRDLLAGRVAAIEDLAADPRTEGEAARFFASLGAAATIAVPVVQGGRTAAVLVVQHDAPRHWSPEEVDVACEVAGRTRHAAERSRTARALRASEARFRALVDASAQIVWTTDAAGRIFEDSPSWREFTGQSPEEWHAGRWIEAIHPEDAPRVAREWADAVASRKPYSAEYRLRHAASGDTWRMTSARAVPLRNADGTVREWVGMNADISDLHRAGEALRRLNATLEQRVAEQTLERDRIWRSSQDAFVVAAPDGTCLSVSPAYERLLGWTEEEVLSTTFLARVHPDDAERARAELRKLAEGLPSQGFEVRKRHKQGGWRWIAWTAALDDGRIYAVARDVTVEKARAEEVAAVNRQLVAQIEERERVEETLRRMQRLEAVGQLTSGVAHDFNNLLTVVLGNTPREAQHRRGRARRQAAASGWTMSAGGRARRQADGQLLAFSRRQRLEAAGRSTSTRRSPACATCCRARWAAACGCETVLRRGPAAGAGRPDADRAGASSTWRSTPATPWTVGGSLTVETANVRLGEPQRPGGAAGGRLRHGGVVRHRLGHERGGARQGVRALLHHQGGRQGLGPGPRPGLGLAKQSGGGVSDRDRARARAPGEGLPARARRRAAAGSDADAPRPEPAPRARPAGGGAAAPSCWWTTTPPCAR